MPHRLQNPKWPQGGHKMAEGVWKGVYPLVFGRSRHFSLNKFFDPSTPSMRKGRDGEKNEKKKKKENTDENSGHYVVASSRPPERRPLERRTLAPMSPKPVDGLPTRLFFLKTGFHMQGFPLRG